MTSGYIFLILGLLVLASAWLPLFMRGLPVSLAVVAVAAGYVFFSVAGIHELSVEELNWTEQLTRVALVLAIMAAGLSIDRPLSRHTWSSAAWLLAIGLPLTLVLTAALGVFVLQLPVGLAVLMAAVLTPTDPVLAGPVEVGPPGSGPEREVRFALTAEAGVNDGLAFPFVVLGLMLVSHGASAGALVHWFGIAFLGKTLGAAVIGGLVGWLIVLGNRYLPDRMRLQASGSGTVALGLTFFAFGVAEVISANGFVAVFATAVSIRRVARTTDYLRQLHGFAVDVEKVVTMLVLAIFGGLVAIGVIGSITWREVAFVAGTLLVARPIAVLIATPAAPFSRRERLATGYLGVRGLASLYYAVHAAGSLSGDDRAAVLSIVALVVLSSAVLYGVTADAVMRWVDNDGASGDDAAVRLGEAAERRPPDAA